ncbi:hypothetical protein [Phenylobacterium deserti]|uniref:PET hydrolase/cutinase-like domain-containing protein n=1 Tax=Phenylobacterium deserti TaxID=1914756 RepID=A0A328ACF0_9CAUL|nr:hypothetical protein [Phenylobacterium deserti]RAK52167.1 hypothetical protein DJ018_13515 [Phenylobacterium deserti]
MTSLVRMRRSAVCSMVLGLALAGSAAAQQAPPPVKPVGVIGAPGGTGPYPAVAEAFGSMRGNTVYRPAKPAPGPLPLVLWGNGACVDDGLSHAAFLREVASHGFIVIAAGHPRRDRSVEPEPPAAPAPAAGAPAPAPARLSEQTQPQQLVEAIDWAARQNADAASPLHRRIDLQRIGVMGHSCGGLQALSVAADPRVKTAILFNSGVFTDAPPAAQGVLATPKSALERLHGPVAYINGGPTDIAYKNGVDDVGRIQHVPVFFGENGVGHDGTFWSVPNGGDYAQVAASWMAWQLKGDSTAARMFRGADCGLCTRAGWTVRQKGLGGS